NLSVLMDSDDPDADYQSLMRSNIEALDRALNDYDETEAEKNESGEPEDHNHDHDHEVDEDVYNGYFGDEDVEDRNLSDWEGEWQSVYLYLKDGTLDKVFEHKAEDGDMSKKEYKEYYTTGYQTDTAQIDIEGDHITFHTDGS